MAPNRHTQPRTPWHRQMQREYVEGGASRGYREAHITPDRIKRAWLKVPGVYMGKKDPIWKNHVLMAPFTWTRIYCKVDLVHSRDQE